MKYTESHEWVDMFEGAGIVGITECAQKNLGPIVFVELPAAGTHVKSGDAVVVVESTKAAIDIYSPVSGELIAINEDLNHDPGLINRSPYSNGWLFKIRLSNLTELETLLDDKAYQAMFE